MLDILVTLGGTLLGFVMKMMANKAERDALHFEQALALHKVSEESHQAASKRDGKAGRFVRRIIVIAVLFSLTVVPVLAPLMGMPVITETKDSWDLFLVDGSNTTFTYLYGVFLVPEVRMVLLSIVGFYFGTSAARSTR